MIGFFRTLVDTGSRMVISLAIMSGMSGMSGVCVYGQQPNPAPLAGQPAMPGLVPNGGLSQTNVGAGVAAAA